MKDFEAFPHSALVFQKTCACCGKSIYWEKSWCVHCPPHGTGASNKRYICNRCAATATKAEELFRKNLQDIRSMMYPLEQTARPASPLTAQISRRLMMPKKNWRYSMLCTIVTKKCDACGHHETGVLREDGSYLALQPGMKVFLYSTKTEEEKPEFEYYSPT